MPVTASLACHRNRDNLLAGEYRRRVQEIIADNLSAAGWSLSWVSAVDSEGRTIWIAAPITATESVSLCARMKDYSTLMQSLNSLGNVENMSVQRQDRTGAQIDEANAPAEYLHPGLQARATSLRSRAACSPHCDAHWRKAPARSCGVCV
jgi:hypothetical protein